MNADRKFSTCRVKISGNIGRGAVCRVEKSRFTVLFYSEQERLFGTLPFSTITRMFHRGKRKKKKKRKEK